MLLALWTSAELMGQSSSELSPESIRYSANVSFDLVRGTLDADWNLHVPLQGPAGEPLEFLLNRGFTIRHLAGVGVRGYSAAPFDVPDWNRVTIEVDDAAIDLRDSIEVRLKYVGAPIMDGKSNSISEEWIELNVESMWHPLWATTDREMTGTLRLDLPSDWLVAGPATIAREDGKHVLRFIHPQLDVALIASPTLTRTAFPGLAVYHHDLETGVVDALLESTRRCAVYLESRYGGRRSLPAISIVATDRDGIRYARGSFIVFDNSIVTMDRLTLDGHICHELAHHWTALGNFLGPDHWMSEAFAEYVMTRYIRRYFGLAEYERRVRGWESRATGKGPVWTPDSIDRPSPDAMYVVAPWLLARLEERIGRAAFEQFLREYMSEDVRHTSDLLERLEKIAGPAAVSRFRQELAITQPELLRDSRD